MPTVIGFGALNLDLILQVKHITLEGEGQVLGLSQQPGGSAANTIYGLAKLGIDTGFVGAVGADDAGKQLLASFLNTGVDTSSIVRKPRTPSGMVIALADRAGNRSLYMAPGANSKLSEADLVLPIMSSYLDEATLVHFSSFADKRQLALQIRALSSLPAKVQVSFAPGTLYAERGMTSLRPFLERADFLFGNRTEIEKLTGTDLVAGAHICLGYGCKTVVVTLGSGVPVKDLPISDSSKVLEVFAGTDTVVAYVTTKDQAYLVKPAHMAHSSFKVSDTVGAGDAFAAGFLFGSLKGYDTKTCGQLGALVANFSVRKTGARAGLPNLEELQTTYLQVYHRPL